MKKSALLLDKLKEAVVYILGSGEKIFVEQRKISN